MLRALVAGAVVAVLAVAVAVALVATDVIKLEREPEAPARVLVVAAAPDQDGVDVATLAFVLDRGEKTASLLDTEKTVAVEGTTAHTARAALPFGGGEAVSRALAEQTGGEALPWVVLSSATWTDLVDEAGGIEVDVPEGVSAYADGRLVLLAAGRGRLDGSQALALASAVDYLDSAERKAETVKALDAGLSAVVALRVDKLGALVSSGGASSSLPVASLDLFATP